MKRQLQLIIGLIGILNFQTLAYAACQHNPFDMLSQTTYMKSGENALVKVTIKNNDSADCDNSKFHILRYVSDEFKYIIIGSDIREIAPGESVVVDVLFKQKYNLPAGEYSEDLDVYQEYDGVLFNRQITTLHLVVQDPNAQCFNRQPQVLVNAAQINPNETAEFEIYIKNTDDSGCAPVTMRVEPWSSSDFTQNMNPSDGEVTLSPGEVGKINVTAISNIGPLNIGTYELPFYVHSASEHVVTSTMYIQVGNY